jgi:glutaredoxin
LRRGRRELAALAGAVAVCLLLPGCRDETGAQQQPEEPPTVEEALQALQGFCVKDGDPSLVFQYFAPETGKLEVARKVEEIPEGARGNVIVLCTRFKKGDLPADLVIVACLDEAQEDGSYPYRLASRYEVGERCQEAPPNAGGAGAGPAAAGPATAASADKVLLFTAPGCPHCRTARQWLQGKGLPFEEKDLESDPSARPLLAELAGKEGIPPSMLNSVPILYVKGKLMLGFNAQEVERAWTKAR